MWLKNEIPKLPILERADGEKTTKTFLSYTRAPLIKPKGVIYEELKRDIFESADQSTPRRKGQ